jgi:hypothetical protein
VDVNDSGSLSKLDLSGNDLRVGGLSEIADVLNSTSITQLNLADNGLTHDSNYGRTHFNSDMSGVIKFAGVLQDSGSLASLDISDNNIGDEQEAKIKQICADKSITLVNDDDGFG